jgi:hypothetical protein
MSFTSDLKASCPANKLELLPACGAEKLQCTLPPIAPEAQSRQVVLTVCAAVGKRSDVINLKPDIGRPPAACGTGEIIALQDFPA